MRILELGCGWGSLALELAARFPRAAIVAVSNSTQPARRSSRPRRGAAASATCAIETADIARFAPAGALRPRGVGRDVRARPQLPGAPRAASPAGSQPDGALFVHVFCHRRFAYPFEIERRRQLDGPPLLFRRADAEPRPAAGGAEPADARRRAGNGAANTTRAPPTPGCDNLDAHRDELTRHPGASGSGDGRPGDPPLAAVLPGLRRALRDGRRHRMGRRPLSLRTPGADHHDGRNDMRGRGLLIGGCLVTMTAAITYGLVAGDFWRRGPGDHAHAVGRDLGDRRLRRRRALRRLDRRARALGAADGRLGGRHLRARQLWPRRSTR